MPLKTVVYCDICTFPPEYCEFSGKIKRCKVWLQENHPDLYTKLYGEEGSAGTSTATTENKLEKSLRKLEIKQENRDQRELAKKMGSKVVIKRLERTKRKCVVAISGLEVFEIDMKKLSKTFASKFATGCSVSKSAVTGDEIIVQGDVADEAEQYIKTLLSEKGLTSIKVERVDDKMKKKVKT
ncbi:probable Translation machinery-associated protein 22 [Saccharomycodes ludwigii]|uniref:Translation machinery-associated protein 22 n=1 Tax=Saccharomycodes ludwigii TaxID=36035 RepID=A0A376BC52_9ASCO|nr:hypothetical protein SCDLUD_004455 [Saccharomycodes ludwigii]KAH3899033.1 hypothetical protein SCDLUD_004455 [Saccharomycodes ludwigii]SSD61710.1 probable Translation machinery-associated protein 22 [Saccharomycodes ludwigii]